MQDHIPVAIREITEVIAIILTALKRVEGGDSALSSEECLAFQRIQNICYGNSLPRSLQSYIITTIGTGIADSQTAYADKGRRPFAHTIGRFLNNKNNKESRIAMASELTPTFLQIRKGFASFEEVSQEDYFPPRLTPQLASFRL